MKLITTLLLALVTIVPASAVAQWYPWGNWYGPSPYFYTPYQYNWNNYFQPRVYVIPVQPAVPGSTNPNLTIPPLPKQKAPTGFQWKTIVEKECNCVRWVLVPKH